MKIRPENFFDIFTPQNEADEALLIMLVTRVLNQFGGIGYHVIDVDAEGWITVALTLVGMEPELMAVYVVDWHLHDPEIHPLRVVMADDGQHENFSNIIEMMLEEVSTGAGIRQ